MGAAVIAVITRAWRRKLRRPRAETPEDQYRREIREIQGIRDRVTARRGYGAGARSTGISGYSGGGFGGGFGGGHGGGCGGHTC